MYSSKSFTAWMILAAFILATGAAARRDRADDAFSGERAMALLEMKCDMGPRLPGSPGHQALRLSIESHADSLGLGFASLCFDRADPGGGGALHLCNLVVTCGDGDGPPLWLGAHYDTRPHCDLEPDPAQAALPLIGANDGASGVAVLLHLAELFAAVPPSRPVALIFFDGEDSGLQGNLSSYCLGSQHLAERWDDFGSPLAGPRPEGLIVIDMVGERGLDIPYEPMSWRAAGDWLEAIFHRAFELGLTAFRPEPGRNVYDDHVPFIQCGLRAVDLIDFDFPQWHTTGDIPAVCAPASLEQVGRLLADIAYRPLDH
ncbi:M28 family peptidase [bacterium]|nr:M28 family peptidase [bacterium]